MARGPLGMTAGERNGHCRKYSRTHREGTRCSRSLFRAASPRVQDKHEVVVARGVGARRNIAMGRVLGYGKGDELTNGAWDLQARHAPEPLTHRPGRGQGRCAATVPRGPIPTRLALPPEPPPFSATM